MQIGNSIWNMDVRNGRYALSDLQHNSRALSLYVKQVGFIVFANAASVPARTQLRTVRGSPSDSTMCLHLVPLVDI
jgi:hypothetical protein